MVVTYKRVLQIAQTPGGSEVEQQTVSEERTGFFVTIGSSLERLLQAYIAQGGNPCDISLYLEPDEVLLAEQDTDPSERATDAGLPSTPADQPYYGVVSSQNTDSYGPGGRYRGGLSTLLRDTNVLAGRYLDASDAGSRVWGKVDFARRWVSQGLQELSRLENQIMRLVDLREQLLREMDEILVIAVGGTVDGVPFPDPDRFPLSVHLSRIVSEMDSVFYVKTASGSPDFSVINKGTGAAPSGISLYDTLFENPPGTDPYSSG